MAREVANARASLDLAWAWAKARDWKGIDPYDALASPLAAGAGSTVGRLPTIALTQVLKRVPFDVRPLLGIAPARNAKAIALLLSAAARSGRAAESNSLARLLLSLRSPGWGAACWGYPFPWRSRAFFLPAGTPTVVVTAFAGEACLDAHAVTGSAELLDAARSACEFLLGLERIEDSTGACLPYSPLDRTAVYNASVLGAKLLVLAGKRLGDPSLVAAARPLVEYVLARQRDDGSWRYGEASFHEWIDSFHTGFVLCSLYAYQRATGDETVAAAVRKGATFYADRFFGPSGEPYWAPGRQYPRDIHSAAQGVLTFLALRDLDAGYEDRAALSAAWMIEHLLGKNGAFFYQERRTHTVRIPYMRWSQAWGIRALAELTR